MGTEVQSKMHLPGPGYFILRDVDDKIVNGNTNLHHERRATNNGQFTFLARSSFEGYFGYEKQHMRQTILSHEVIFKHQLHELHRLYKRQTDLMNELELSKLCKAKTPVEMQQANLFSSRFSSKDVKSTSYLSSVSPVNLTRSTPPTPGSVRIHSSMRPMKEVDIQNGVRLEDYGSFESRSKKLHRRLFDLEVPADRYTDEDIKLEVTHHREDRQPSLSNSPLWNREFADLNETVKFGESTSSISVEILGDVNFCKGSVTRQNSFVDSSSNLQFLSEKAMTENAQYGRDGERNNLLGKTKRNSSIVHTGCHPSDSSPFDRSKWIFGVDISETRNVHTVLHSHTPDSISVGIRPFGSSVPFSQDQETNSTQKLISGNLVITDAQINPEKKLQNGLPWLRKKPIWHPDIPEIKPSSFSSINDDSSQKIESLNTDSALNSVLVKSTRQLHIDLNMCLNEEESSSVFETELVVSQEESDRIAAEAIVAISSYHDPADKTISLVSQATPFDSLNWFADLISSYSHNDLDNKIDESVSTSKNNDDSCEKKVTQFDYFEFMTLRLTETEVDECYHKPEASGKIPIDEEKLPKRAQRGKSRRGRQRKDFQRDVLPSISSLSKLEVSEDFQIIEGLIRTTGGIWESGLKKRNGKGSSRGRRRSDSGGSAHIPIISTVLCPAQIQQTNVNETGFAEQRLTGWGKRTRRLSRNRCPVLKYPVLVK